MITLRHRIMTLPLIAVDVCPAEEGEFIEEIVGDCTVTFTHEYSAYHGACIVASIKGTELGYRECLNLISNIIGISPCQLTNSTPRVVIWESGSTEIPQGRFVKALGEKRVQEICDEFELPADVKPIIDRALALSGWFMIHATYEEAKFDLYQQTKMYDHALRDKIVAALDFIKQEYVDFVASKAKPG